jgi:putative phage-type endonuclease
MNTVDIKQGTPEWLSVRAGRVTASRVADVIAKTKTGYSASRKNYMDELVKERFGVMPEPFTNAAMQWGTEQEPFARMEYESRTGNMVLEVGFLHHPTIEMAGASPDGVIYEAFKNVGLLEIKNPNTSTHFDYLLANEVPEKYKPQMAFQCCCTGAKWVDFLSYDSRSPKGLDYFCIRYEPEKEYMEYIEAEVIKFLKEVDERYAALVNKLL